MSTHAHCGALLTAIETVEARLAQLKATATEAHALSADDAPDGSAAKFSMASSALQEVHSLFKTDCIEMDRLAFLIPKNVWQPSSSPQASSAPQASAGFGSGGSFGNAPAAPAPAGIASSGPPEHPNGLGALSPSQSTGVNPFFASTTPSAVVARTPAAFTPGTTVNSSVPFDTQAQRDAASIVAPYSVTLNQANISMTNTKVYFLQVVAVPPAEGSDNAEPKIGFFTRWGRVGEQGQFAWSYPVTEADAVRMFEKKFEDKTRQPFASLMDGSFQPQPQRWDVTLV